MHILTSVLSRRLCSSSAPVRVRFAPSPTGHLHLGGLRTALFNYLFARSKQGTFVLRIEDTDQKRLVPEAIKRIEEDLSWCSIVVDEGPSAGGNYGPYCQSERLEFYRDKVTELLDAGLAYPCFCDQRRLALLKSVTRISQKRGYDNRCRSLSNDEAEANLTAGIPYSIRFRLQPNLSSFTDYIHGFTTRNVYEVEGDPIIMKPDGYPTYHLACVVDDHMMKISHVFRGEEWLISTVKHLQLYEAFGWKPPAFGHVYNIQDADGSKLSKRKGHADLSGFRENRYYAVPLITYACRRDLNRLSEMSKIEPITLLRKMMVESVSSVDVASRNNERRIRFNVADINSLNREYCIEEENRKMVLNDMRQMILDEYGIDKLWSELVISDDYMNQALVLAFAETSINTIGQLLDPPHDCYWVRPSTVPEKVRETTDLSGSDIKDALLTLIRWLEDDDHQDTDKHSKAFTQFIRDFAKERKLKFHSVMIVVRYALTGCFEGAPVARLIKLFGLSEVRTRLERLSVSL